MEIGLIGLGKMGGNMAERLRRGGHTVIGFDRSESAPRDVATVEELVQKLAKPRVVWVMVPSGDPTRATVHTRTRICRSCDGRAMKNLLLPTRCQVR